MTPSLSGRTCCGGRWLVRDPGKPSLSTCDISESESSKATFSKHEDEDHLIGSNIHELSQWPIRIERCSKSHVLWGCSGRRCSDGSPSPWDPSPWFCSCGRQPGRSLSPARHRRPPR